MRVFISHASKNKEIVLKFSRFLENINSDIDVFCSSEKGSIKVGSNFVEAIFKELNEPELFTPVPDNRLNTGKTLIKMKKRLSPKR